MIASTRVVFDCNTLLQGLASPRGPAGRCVQLAIDGRIGLFISPVILEELREVTARPRVIAKLHLDTARVEEFIALIEASATILDGFPEPFVYQRDPDDAHYVNLAHAAGARLIVTRDNDLLDLMDLSKPEAIEFQKFYPALRIVNPVAFLTEFGISSQ
jgi:putative PIN family toxin of toxin-antitoxin system